MPDQDRKVVRTFGIGCFTFSMAGDDTSTPKEWASKVKQALLAIPSVDKVTINLGLQDVFPPIDFSMSFELTIPKRFHESLFPIVAPDYEGERFRVETRYDYYGPWSFVVCLDSIDEGSEAVVLVREFLERELAKRAEDLVLNSLGPSPMHVDGVLIADSMADQWRSERIKQPGYDLIAITYPSSRVKDPDAALATLMDDISPDASLFYELVRRADRRGATEDDLREATERLVETHQAKGLRAWSRRLFRSAEAARTLGLKALDAKLAAAADSSRSQQELSRIDLTGVGGGVLGPDLEEEASSNSSSAAISSALEVVEFLEGGRSKEVEVLVIGLATLLGGVAGAVAAILTGS